jgi:iron complex transport system ATP-binding protein
MKLKTKDLNIGYGDKILLQNINFEANSGDFIAIIGKNGSGKSTLLKTLGNILPKISGDIVLDDQNLDNIENLEKSKLISIVLTEKIDIPLSVQEVLQLGRQAYSDYFDRLSAKDYEIIDTVSAELELTDLLTRPIQQLSDGEQQKVMIARSLVQETPIILLDEPSTHLDIENKAMLVKLLKKISHTQNKIVILSTHDINLILPMADKLWIINNNTINALDNLNNTPQQLTKIFDNQLIKYDADCQIFKLI